MLYRTQNPHGGDIYDPAQPVTLDFSANTNPYGTPPGVIASLREAITRVDRYPDPYCRALVKAIAAHENLPEGYILCGSGAAELIYSYCAALRPAQAAELAPTFSEYSLGLEGLSCEVARYPLRQEEGFLPGADFLPWVERTAPEVLFLCNPNNPTGRLLPPELLGKLLSLCKEKNIRLFLDECFLDLSEGGQSMKDHLAGHPGLFLLRAFTKSYGMAGVRLGYGLSSDGDLLARMAAAVQPWNVSTLAQAAGTAALKETAFLQKTRALIAGQRPWLKEQLEALGFWVCPGSANYLLFQGQSGLSEALRRRGVGLRDCSNYFGLGPGWYRAAVRLPEENQKLIEALKAVLSEG